MIDFVWFNINVYPQIDTFEFQNASQNTNWVTKKMRMKKKVNKDQHIPYKPR